MSRRFLAAIVAFAAVWLTVAPAVAESIDTDTFQRTWARTDQPVANQSVSRTWMWGPEPFTGLLQEFYDDAPGDQRHVQYFDKSRMEDNAYREVAPWDVTNGLLAVELMTGRMQLGDDHHEQYAPAQVNVAGDLDDPHGPTYATFNGLTGHAPIPTGWTITQTVNRAGEVGDNQALAAYGVTAAVNVNVPGLNHTVASVFWDFMTSSGLVHGQGETTIAPLFEDAYYATGYPVTEAYWTSVLVGGVSKQVLVQVFERRVLTYTPDNPDGWKVEAGNVGLHYYTWRYGSTLAPGPHPGESFGDGAHIVDIDIPAGIYRNSDSSQGCYWERLVGDSDEMDDIIANEFTTARTIVEIKSSDWGFYSEGCGTWSSDLSPITPSPTASFGDGTYFVGSEVASGVWQNSSSVEGCYWERLSGFGGELDDIIENEFTYEPQTVQISTDDVGFATTGCGLWTRIAD